MPYIEPSKRFDFDIAIASPGQLNFAITKLIWLYICKNGMSYTSLNTAIGVLECAKLEMYRRVAAPYEDDMCSKNGDVYSERGVE
jgi:hypothetical protein